jgi:hypothetical protein
MIVDQRIARDARLRLGDLPPGWVAQNTASVPTAEAPCPGLRKAAGFISAGMLSPAFSVSAGDVESAQSETYIYADAALAKHWFKQFSSRSTQVCLARVLRRDVGAAVSAEGITLGPIRVRRLPGARAGNQAAAFRVIVPAFTSEETIEVDADVVFVRVGRGLEIFSLAGVGSPFDPGLKATLVRAVSARLAGDLRRAP